MKHKKSDHYLKVVEWSAADQCYVGTAPGLLLGGVHGKDQKKVFQELCLAVDETIKLLEKEGRPLPEATANKKHSGKILLRLPQDLHKSIWLRALKEGLSINNLIQSYLQKAIV